MTTSASRPAPIMVQIMAQIVVPVVLKVVLKVLLKGVVAVALVAVHVSPAAAAVPTPTTTVPGTSTESTAPPSTAPPPSTEPPSTETSPPTTTETPTSQAPTTVPTTTVPTTTGAIPPVSGTEGTFGGAAGPSEGRDGGDDLEILRVDQRDGVVTVDVAIPPTGESEIPVAENFAVTDGGVLVEAAVTSIGQSADTVLVIDTSGSMRGPALTSATAAAAGFVQALPADVRVGLVSFGETATTHHRPTTDRAAVLADLEDLRASGQETALWDGLVVAAEIVGSSDAGPGSVVVLSDGDDTVSTATRAAVTEQFGANGAVLYAVAIQTADTNLGPLDAAVTDIGGRFLSTTDLDQLDSIYADIRGRLVGRYRLRFEAAATGQRTVVVSVASTDGVSVASVVLTGPPADEPAAPATTAPELVAPANEGLFLGPAVPVSIGPLSGRLLLLFGLLNMFGALAIGGVFLTRPTHRVRLDPAVGSDRLKGANVRIGHAVNRVIVDYERGRRLDARLEAANVNLRPGEFLLAWLTVTAALSLTMLALVGLFVAALIAALSAAVALAVLNIRTRRRRDKFADQLTESLSIMAGSLRSGQSLPRAIELVAAEAPVPTAEEFHRISFEVRFGRDLTDSIRETASRMGSPDLEWLAQAVDINRELGGDLTEILDNVATTIRERRTVARQIEALSAEGRATGWVLLGLPVALLLFSWWRTPDNVAALFIEPLGRILLGVAMGGMTVGHVWIRRLVRLKF